MNAASLRAEPPALATQPTARERTVEEAPASPRIGQIYVYGVILLGAAVLLTFFPHSCARPTLFILFLGVSSAAAGFKINLPLSKGGSTMSVSYAADFTAMLLIGPSQTMLISMVSAWAQCAFNTRRKNPFSRTVFSMASLIVTVQLAGLAYRLLGGRFGHLDLGGSFAEPLVGAAAVYFLANTLFVATAIALSSGQSIRRVWYQNFLWTGPSYFVGAGTAAVLALIIDRTGQWFALLAAAPVYLTHRTYQIYLGRMEDEQRHVEQIKELHWATMEALELAKRSEKALASEKERLAITLRSIGDGVVTIDTRGQIVMLNNMAEVLTGWSQAEALGKPLDAVLHVLDPDTHERLADPLVEVDGADHPDGRRQALLRARDGAERVIERIATPLHDKDGVVGMVLVIRDVTDATSLEQERLKASKLESLGILAGGIAHDFNNILMAVVGNLSLASMAAVDEKTRKRLSEAEKACVRARSLTQQLLTFSKGGAPVRKTMAVGALLEDSSQFALRGANVKCEVAIPPDLWQVDADEGQMNQVINNIVLNAKQAMPKGGTVRVSADNLVIGPDDRPAGFDQPDGRYVRLSIADEGTGIPEEIRRRIFDPYFTTKPKGSGLGLASSYSIIRKHDGCIGVESQVGVGTTFHIYLPVSAKQIRAVAAPQETMARGRGRVLLMDDEDVVRDVAGEMLQFIGYEVVAVADGRDAIETYKREMAAGRRFDAVITDLTVPGGMGGKDAVSALREFDPDVHAIVSSGYADDPVMAEFRRYGFRGVVAKPFTVKELAKVLHTAEAAAAVA
ncbi:MAG TPA: ATP-binding protein [Vicinamibacterales bacterium]|nr:ATP-binding protein [Vicinamibacterales bacterium]